MRCEDVRDRIDGYAAGTLPPAGRAALEAHLAGCAECREDVAAAEFLGPQVAALPRAIDPPSELWPTIHARIAGRRPAIAVSRGALLAASVALVAVSSAVTAVLLRHRGDAATPAPPVVAAAPLSEETPYLRAAADLADALALHEQGLSPHTVAVLRRNLAVIDSAIAESRAALAHDSTNAGLRALLRASHRQKLDLLQQAVGLPRRS